MRNLDAALIPFRLGDLMYRVPRSTSILYVCTETASYVVYSCPRGAGFGVFELSSSRSPAELQLRQGLRFTNHESGLDYHHGQLDCLVVTSQFLTS